MLDLLHIWLLKPIVKLCIHKKVMLGLWGWFSLKWYMDILLIREWISRNISKSWKTMLILLRKRSLLGLACKSDKLLRKHWSISLRKGLVYRLWSIRVIFFMSTWGKRILMWLLHQVSPFNRQLKLNHPKAFMWSFKLNLRVWRELIVRIRFIQRVLLALRNLLLQNPRKNLTITIWSKWSLLLV